MTKKNKILYIILGLINLIATLAIIIYALPNKIPVSYDIYEKITHFSSKWIMLISAVVPTIIIILIVTLKNKKIIVWLKTLFILSLFENLLYLSYFVIGENLTLGARCEIPFSISIFMPISIIIIIFSIGVKNAPYLSKPAINFAVTRKTEFIWKQTHFFAQKVCFITGLILFIISIIFSIFRFFILEFIIFVLAILISTLVIYLFSKSIYNKYIEMEKRKEKLKNKEKFDENETSNKKSKRKNKKKIDGSRLM